MENPSYARQSLSAEMRELERQLLEMGSLAESMVSMASDALWRLDTQLAREVLVRDDEVDQRDLEIENHCLRLLALQQPMGSDLRVIGTAMKMITDIERVGDLAVDIARAALKIEKEIGDTAYIDIPKFAQIARTMFRDALDSYVRHDIDIVNRVIAQDDEADAMYRRLRDQIHEHMRVSPEDVVSASWMILAVHHLERIADHAVNIAERVEFMVTGSTAHLTGGRRLTET